MNPLSWEVIQELDRARKGLMETRILISVLKVPKKPEDGVPVPGISYRIETMCRTNYTNYLPFPFPEEQESWRLAREIATEVWTHYTVRGIRVDINESLLPQPISTPK